MEDIQVFFGYLSCSINLFRHGHVSGLSTGEL